MSNEEPPDQRRYKRIKKHFLLTFFVLTDPVKRHEASQLKNISLGGICIITAQPYPVSAKLGIELKTPLIAEMTHLEGTVLESHERVKGIIYETRVEFDPLSNQAKFVLNNLIEHFDKHESDSNE